VTNLRKLSLSPYLEQPNNQRLKLQAVLWICIGFNVDPDPAFYLKADLVPGSQTKAYPDPDPGQTLSSLKV